MRPNVLLIVLDSARADALEPYGAPAGASPAIEQLARRGAALPHAYANACWTVPSHAALFTGLLPRAAGLIRAPGGTPRGCRPVLEAHRARLLADVLGSAGYDARAVSTNLWLTPESGFDIGFERFVPVDSQRQGAMHREDWRGRLRWGLEALRARADDGAREALDVMLGWTREEQSRPFFWFVNLIECHTPYLPPRPFHALGPLGRLRAAAEARRHLSLDEIWRASTGGFNVPEPALERMRRLYAASIRLLDDWVARLLEGLDAAGRLDDTLVMVVADHGENFGEGGMMAHAFSLDNRLLHVPCVVAGPGHPVVEHAFGLDDLPSHIAEAIGLESHPWRANAPTGVAVAQFDPPTTDRGDERVRAAVDRWGLDEPAVDRLTTSMTSATDGRLKLLLRGDREELYDVVRDPGESAPISEPDPGLEPALASLRAALAAGCNRAGEGEAPGPEAISDEERLQLEERMRLLGYL